MRIAVRKAHRRDVLAAARVIGLAALRLVMQGAPLWAPHELTFEGLLGAIDAGELYVATLDNQAVGVFRLQWEDPMFWPEVKLDESGYIHRLAVIPQHQGKGIAHQMLVDAMEIVRSTGRLYLRLECEDRAKLRNVYESFGFRSVDRIMVDDILTCRYEMQLTDQREPR
jgi:GNAT superfamily N-acetyltransferase